MNQVRPPSQNGLSCKNLPPSPPLNNNHTYDDVIVTKKQSVDGNPEQEVGEVKPSEPPARGLELIYKVAEELATRIADEKRYEGIIKPCSVSILRISDASQFKIIRDRDLIKDEIINNEPIGSNQLTIEKFNELHEEMQIECYDSSDEEDEIIIPPAEKDIDEKSNQPNEETVTFFCIFCYQKNIQGKSNATDHYQSHMDYYPFKCTQCLEVTTNLTNLFIHYRKDHSEEKTATFKKKLMPWISEWIEDFLKSQILTANRRRTTQPRAYCPVCESSEKKEDIITLPPNLIQPRKHFMHVYKHLCYEPYVCAICQKEGKKFTINDFDDRAYEHIMKNHPEAEDELLAKVYQKSRYIKPLEGYILHYLTSAGVSTKRRLPEKIPNFTRNKLKAKYESKEKTNTDKDNNQTATLIDLVNQSSSTSLLLNDQLDSSFQIIGQKPENLINLSNQTKGNANTHSTSHQMSKTPPTIHKPITMLTSNSLSFSPTKGSSPQFTTLSVNNLPLSNSYTVSSVSILPNHHTINGINSPQSIILPNYHQPNVIQLPCGQLMVRNNNCPPRVPISIQPKFIPQQQSTVVSLLRSPPAILRRPSITSLEREPLNQNEPIRVQISPDIGNDIQNKLKQSRDEDFVKRSYFCMFCKEMIRFESFIDGLFHFSKHLHYNPVNCLLCGEKFTDIDKIMEHFIESHAHKKVCQSNDECAPLLYYINRDGHTEKWVEQFLYFQTSGEFDKLASVDCAPYCSICKSIQKFVGTRPTNNNNHVTPPVEIVRQHLNLHINYRPYECYLCSRAGNQVRFASIGDNAIKHLKSHGFSPIDSTFFKEFFHYKPILELENFVKNYLITEFYPYANASGYGRDKSQTNEQPTPFSLNGVNNQASYLKCSGDNVSKRLFADPNSTNDPTSPFSPPSSSQNHDFKRFARASYACYHCKLTIDGIPELVTHCKTNHPNLSVASYCLPTLNGVD